MAEAAINPGLGGMFPWLSVLSYGFESYRIHRMRFIYRPLRSASEPGSVYMMIDYDPSDNNLGINKSQFMAADGAQSGPLWSGCYVDFYPQNQPFTKKFLRQGTVSNLNTYDAGQLLVAIDGAGTTNPLGDLYVEYDIELITPQLVPNIVQYNSQSIQINGAAGTATAWYPVNVANSYTSTAQQIAHPVQTDNAGSLRIQFDQVGQWLVEVFNSGIDTSGGAATVVVNSILGTTQQAVLAETAYSSMSNEPCIISFAVNVLTIGSMVAMVLNTLTSKNQFTQVRISPYYFGYI